MANWDLDDLRDHSIDEMNYSSQMAVAMQDLERTRNTERARMVKAWIDKDTLSQMMSGVSGSPAGVYAAGGSGTPNKPTPSLYEMLAMRMRWFGDRPPFPQVQPFKRDEEVFVFIVPKAGEPVVLTDEAALYPSDKLITSLRVLEGA